MTLIEIVLWQFLIIFILDEIRVKSLEKKVEKLEKVLEGRVILTDISNITREDKIVITNKVQ